MSSSHARTPSRHTLSIAVALGITVGAVVAAPASAQAPTGARRCPTCAPAPDPSTTRRGASGGIARRGAAGAAAQPMTDVSISLGATRVSGRVDAQCGVDQRATARNTRFYYRMLYPWFGQKVAADKPQWRVGLEIRPASSAGRYDQFVFSFHDGERSGTIQTVAGAERMGSGTVRVTRHGNGARFDVAGRTKEGEAVRATIDCSQFQGSEAAGG